MRPRPPVGPLGLSRPGTLVLRAGVVAWSLVGLGLVAYGLFRVADVLRTVLFTVGLAALIVLILEPAVSRIARRIPRIAAAALVYVAILAPAAAGLWWLGGVLVRQVGSLLDQAPELLETAGGLAEDAWTRLGGLGLPLPAPTLQEWIAQNRAVLTRGAVSILTAATRATGLLLAVLIGPIVAFYALAELPRLQRGITRLIPSHRRDQVREAGRIVGRTVGAFFRGQLLISLIVGVASAIGLLLLGVPYAALIATIAGVTNLVPFLGPIVGSIPGIAIGFADGGIWLAVKVLVLFVVVQQLESQLLSPLVLGASVRLRPVFVLVGMLAGAVLAGILGMLLAIPVLASAKALYERFGPSDTPSADEPADDPEPAAPAS